MTPPLQAHLLLRFEAPLMAFGAVAVDDLRESDVLPYRSMLAGLLGNALGYSHGDAGKLQALQEAIVYATRADVPGTPHVDYQTADLGQPYLLDGFWTTRGFVDGRDGASGKTTTIRHRHYRADAVITTAIALAGPSLETVEALARALREPARPLFLGRKACVPSTPILLGIVEATDVLAALEATPLHRRSPRSDALTRWPDSLGERPKARTITLFEDRDWTQQIHAGRRKSFEGVVAYSKGAHP